MTVAAEELTLSDFVRGRGRVVREPVDHETREGFVTVIFSRRGQEQLAMIPSNHELQVRCVDDE